MSKILENENKLLLLCSRTCPKTAEHEQIATLAKSHLDWDALLKMAFHHKTWPLLYKNLSSICPDAIPDDIRQKLKKKYVNNSIWNMERLRLLQEITLLFDKHNIDFLTVKGPLLTLQYFGDIAYRSFGDLDILVRKRDLKKATDLILNLGFDFFPEGLSEQYYYWFARMNHHGNLDNGKGLHVEVHWELSGHYRGLLWTYEELEPFIEQIELPGGSFVKTLNAEMMLLYLSLHGQRHYWQRYDYVCVLSELIQKKKEMDWKMIGLKSGHFRINDVMCLAICLTQSLFKMIVLDTFKEAEKKQDAIEKSNICIKNYSTINHSAISVLDKQWKDIIPRQVRIIGPKLGGGMLEQRVRRYVVPQLKDWEKYSVSYRWRIVYFFYRPLQQIIDTWHVLYGSTLKNR